MKLRHKLPLALFAGAVCMGSYADVARAHGPNHQKSDDKADARPLSDAEILGVAEMANAGTIAQNELAEKKARKQTARSFAALMVAEQDDVERRTESLARELGAEQSPMSLGMKRTNGEIQRKLKQAAPPAFDRVYLQTEIDAQEKVLNAFDDHLIPDAKSPKLRALLGELRSDAAHHLQIAKETLSELNKAS